jgi:hypothetical protein
MQMQMQTQTQRQKRVKTPIKHRPVILPGVCAGQCGKTAPDAREVVECSGCCSNWFCVHCVSQGTRSCFCWPRIDTDIADGMVTGVAWDRENGERWCAQCMLEFAPMCCTSCNRIACGACCQLCIIESDAANVCIECAREVCAACAARGERHVCSPSPSPLPPSADAARRRRHAQRHGHGHGHGHAQQTQQRGRERLRL